MRWKLLILVVLAATIAGFGGWAAVTIAVFGSAKPLAHAPLWLLVSLIIPIFFVFFSAFFVYRHTSRRRKLQATLTAIVVAILTLAMYALFAVNLLSR
jgi:hypothetical protein